MVQSIMGGSNWVKQLLAGDQVARREGYAPAGCAGLGAVWRAMLRSSVSLIAFAALPALSAVINDTGIKACGDAKTTSVANCATVSASFPRQDALQGRDAQAGAGKGFNFSKIADDGRVLNANAPDWSCTQDNVTGLIWEVKTTSGLRDQNHTYSWYLSSPSTAGVNSGGSCQTTGRCDTEKYVADVNGTRLCGYNDWRMPNVKELEGLVDFSRLSPSIDTAYFPYTPDRFYWTSTRDAAQPHIYAWFVEFMEGSVLRDVFVTNKSVRLVRGNSVASELILTDNGTTVTDNSTGLMWKRHYEMKVPGQPAAWGSGNPDTFNWTAALNRAVTDTTGGHQDWRLPSVKELRSLIDETRFYPALNTSFFAEVPIQTWWWSSSPYLNFFNNTDFSWVVGGDNGQNQGNPRTNGQYVRLVRDTVYVAPTAPGAPTGLIATPLDGSARIAFTPPVSDGGAAIDRYTASCVAGASTLTGTASSSPITVTGMTTSSYSCTVVAHNIAGNGPPSSPAVTVGACSYLLGSSSASVSYGANVGNVNVTSACPWTAVSSDPWITVTSGASATGSASVVYAVAANVTGATRTGTLTIAKQAYTVTQASNCSFTLGTPGASFTSDAGDGTFSVTTTSNCGWSVAITDGSDSWISVIVPRTASLNPGVTSTGNFHVKANLRKSPRTGTLTIAGLPFVVTQEAAATSLIPVCTLAAAELGGGQGMFTLTASCSPVADSYVWSDANCISTESSCIVTPSKTTTYTVAGTKLGEAGDAGSVTVTVSTADQSIGAISFLPATLAVGGTTTARATASSGLAVNFSSTTPSFCTVSGSTVTGIAEGTCTVAANQAGDPTHNAAPSMTLALTINPAPHSTVTGTLTTRYRLYNASTREHLYTTDLNEYSVLGASVGWVAEGAIYKLFQGPGSFSGVDAVAYYRVYNPSSHQHHWTTDLNEYNVLGAAGWSKEGVDGYILPTAATGSLPLYRLYLNASGGLHLWTIDANEKAVLIATAGWVDEGVAGYVMPLP